MSTTRATTARHVRQRKLNTKQPLRIFRESEVEEPPDDESQRHIPQVETGVEKGEEVEYHLQAVINAANAAALGAATAKQSYIPTPDAVQARGVQYDELYPKVFSQPSTYIRFSSTVEDSIGTQYCMNDDDVEFLAKLNDGKDPNSPRKKGKPRQCSEDTFEEIVSFFEDTAARLQPFANVDNAPTVSLDEMQRTVDDAVSTEAQQWLKPIYSYWVLRKGSRSLMPTIKVRVLDTASDADDADPYVCFRRREVRQTRKTRGRDAQVVEKLKKLRLELEQARQLVQLVVQREQLHKEDLEISRKVFSQRGQLKQVKATKNIVGDKGDDEELLVNIKPAPKTKARQDSGQPRPQNLRVRSIGDRSAPESDLIQLTDIQAEAEATTQSIIAGRKEQHRKWNNSWVDETWRPITPPLEDDEQPPRWAPLLSQGTLYPTPPPTLPSESPIEGGDVEMDDAHPIEADMLTATTPEPEFIFHIPGAYPISEDERQPEKRNAAPACRLRYGRGGRCFLETKHKRRRGLLSSGVVSDSDSDEEDRTNFFRVNPDRVFEYRCNMNWRGARPEAIPGHQRYPSSDQLPIAGSQGPGSTHAPRLQQQVSGGGAG